MRNTTDGVAFLNAVSASPLPREEVIARLGTAIRRHLNDLAHRERRGWQAAYDEVLEQELEAIASAIHSWQQSEANP
jgi:hypothetical protein